MTQMTGDELAHVLCGAAAAEEVADILVLLGALQGKDETADGVSVAELADAGRRLPSACLVAVV